MWPVSGINRHVVGGCQRPAFVVPASPDDPTEGVFMPSKSPPRDRLISDAEAAELLGCSPTTVRRMRRDLTLSTVKVRNRSMLRESEVLAYIVGGER
jgi:excisionase family DNA binding protein